MIYQTPFVPGSGPLFPNLAVVGEAPGEIEESNLETLVGPTGQDVDKLFRLHGSTLNEHYKTNVFKWRPPYNVWARKEETGHTLEEAEEILWKELEEIKPNAILALGNVPLKTLTGKDGILKWRGSILPSLRHGFKVVPTIHPAALYKRAGDEAGALPYYNKAVISLDFKRALAEASSPSLDLPRRSLDIVTNPNHLLNFFSHYQDKKRLSIDIEVIHAIPSCIGLAFSSSHAISVPLFNPIDWQGSKVIQPHILAQLWDILGSFFESNPDLEIIGQNFKFDHEKIRTTLGWHLPTQIYADTALMAHTCHIEFPKALQFLTSVYTREPYYKDELKEFDPKKHKTEQILVYNARDAAVTFEVAERLEEELKELNLWQFYKEVVNPAHEFYMEIDREGFRINEDKRKELLKKYETWQVECEATLKELNNNLPLNTASPKQVASFLYKTLKFPTRKDTAEPTLIQLLGNHASTDLKRKGIINVLNNRKIRRTISTIINAATDFDGRMRTSFNIGGTDNARTSTQKVGPPLRPVKKPGIGWNFQNLTKHGDIGPDCRLMCVPDEGFVLGSADLSQAEARIVALLSNNHELIEAFEKGQDVHRLVASWVNNKGIEDITSDERFVGKQSKYSTQYGASKKKLMLTINKNAYEAGMKLFISEYQAGKILAKIHEKDPNLRSVFHAGIEDCLSSGRVLFNAFGRRRQFFDRWGDELFRSAYTFIPSSSVHDHLLLAGYRVKKRAPWIRFIIDGHDAWVFQCLRERFMEAARIFKEELEVPIDFERASLSRGKIIIPCDVEMGENYREMKKVKFD